MFCPYSGAESDEDYYCGENNVADKFKTLCERRNRCKVKVNSALFGDPCPEKPKKHLYLTLIFKCGKCLVYVYLNGSKSDNSADVKHSSFLSINKKLISQKDWVVFRFPKDIQSGRMAGVWYLWDVPGWGAFVLMPRFAPHCRIRSVTRAWAFSSRRGVVLNLLNEREG